MVPRRCGGETRNFSLSIESIRVRGCKADISRVSPLTVVCDVTAFCFPPCYLFPRTLGTSAVCLPFAITIIIKNWVIA